MERIRTDWESHDFSGNGTARRLRDILRARREVLRVSRVELGKAIAGYMNARARQFGESEEYKPLHNNTIYSWENFRRHPSIDSMSAWAAVLGLKLHVLVAGDPLEKPVLLRTEEAVHVARTIDGWPDDLVAIVIDLVDQVEEHRLAEEKGRRRRRR